MIGAPTERPGGSPRARLAAAAGWCFLLCATGAAGYGIWALYGSGATVATFDVRPDERPPGAARGDAGADCPEFGPVALDPSLGPHRAVLRTGYAPIGSARFRYEISMADAEGRVLWDRRGFLGSRDDDASFVRHVTSLMDFEVSGPSPHTLRVRFPDGSLDDLREASLEIRGGVVRANPRILWGLGVAAAAALAASLLLSRGTPHPYSLSEEEFREAA